MCSLCHQSTDDASDTNKQEPCAERGYDFVLCFDVTVIFSLTWLWAHAFHLSKVSRSNQSTW